MSLRIKLCITAIFLVLLAIPVTYIALTWHPPNPLRFRIVEDRLEEDPFDVRHTHWIKMELRNTSDVTVTLLSGTLHGHSGSREEIMRATALVSRGSWGYEPVPIPSGGTIEIDFEVQGDLPKEIVAKLRAGQPLAQKGHVEYAWLSSPRAHIEDAHSWLVGKVPLRWLFYPPSFDPFIDTTDVESDSPTRNASPRP